MTSTCICRTAQQCPGLPSPSAVITAPCDALLYHSAQLPLMLTGKAVCSNNASPRKVYVTLVYLLLFAVELLCCDMLWYSCKISFTDLLPAIGDSAHFR